MLNQPGESFFPSQEAFDEWIMTEKSNMSNAMEDIQWDNGCVSESGQSVKRDYNKNGF